MENARMAPEEMRALMNKYRMTFYELLDVRKAGSGLWALGSRL
jgi:hypothetical protein